MTDPTPFDTRAFRSALGAFATGVTIVTARLDNGETAGVTANSFNSVSLNPPMILWSLDKSSRSLRIFESADYWAVHILAADQEALSNRFAKSGQDKFAGLELETGVGGTPLLTGCACRLQCRTAFKYEGGDHVIFLGEVVAFDRNDLPCLVFHGGRYALAARKADPRELSGTSPRDSDISFGEDFLGYLLWRADLHFSHRVAAFLEAQKLDIDSFMILAMLLHRDGRTLDQLANGLLQSDRDGVSSRIITLAERGWIRLDGSSTVSGVWLTKLGRDATLHIHAASKSIETDLLQKMDSSEGQALKHLLRSFILRTNPGLPHPWEG